MAKPVMQNPTIKGKAAKEFSKMFLGGSTLSKEKSERNRKDVELYRHCVIKTTK